MDTLTSSSITSFRRRVLSFYRKHGRKLPFRQTADPYAIAVSEFMLQQTQVSRVLPKYEAWFNEFPSWKSLAAAKRIEVLRLWSGLGYNRRAIYLHDLAKRVVTDFKGVFPDDEQMLDNIAGLGPYTKRAILIFAFNKPLATVDTNIRRVFIAHFKLDEKVSVTELQEIADRVLPGKRAREWHHALMDYGALKLTARSTGVKAVSRQSKFDGSSREVRGAVVRILSEGTGMTQSSLVRLTGFTSKRVGQALVSLIREGMIAKRGQSFRIHQS